MIRAHYFTITPGDTYGREQTAALEFIKCTPHLLSRLGRIGERASMEGRKEGEWWQVDMPPTISESGSFDAYISAVDEPQSDHTAGTSACAWLISRPTSPHEIIFEDCKRSSRSEGSEETRGFVAAALGVVATFRGEVAVSIQTANEYVAKGLNGGAERWRDAGWKTTKGKSSKHAELWKLILGLCEERNIVARGVHTRRKDSLYIQRAHEKALKAL